MRTSAGNMNISLYLNNSSRRYLLTSAQLLSGSKRHESTSCTLNERSDIKGIQKPRFRFIRGGGRNVARYSSEGTTLSHHLQLHTFVHSSTIHPIVLSYLVRYQLRRPLFYPDSLDQVEPVLIHLYSRSKLVVLKIWVIYSEPRNDKDTHTGVTSEGNSVFPQCRWWVHMEDAYITETRMYALRR
jgi:hypothetical protein